MFVKMLTHVHLLVHTLWCWHTLRRRWSLKSREFDSALFEKMKCIFSIGGKFGEVTEVFFAEEHSPDAGLEAPDAVSERPVCRLPGSARVRHRTQARASGGLSPVSARFAKLSGCESGEHRTLWVRPVACIR